MSTFRIKVSPGILASDVIIFRKYSREVLDKIAELREQSPQVLIDAGVLWQDFIDGRYFLEEGRRFVLGEYATVKGQWGDKQVLNSTLKMTEIARLLNQEDGRAASEE